MPLYPNFQVNERVKLTDKQYAFDVGREGVIVQAETERENVVKVSLDILPRLPLYFHKSHLEYV